MRRTLTLVAVVFSLTVDVRPEARTVIHVDDSAPPSGDGRARFPYNDIADAVEAARLVDGSVTIMVAPGEYSITETISIERGLELRGSTALVVDGQGLPTGEIVSGTETRIAAAPPLSSEPLVAVGRRDGVVVDGIQIRGFTFHGATDGAGVRVWRRAELYVSSNLFTGSFLGIETAASSGRVSGNYMSGLGTGAALAGGYPASPSTVLFIGNRAIRNRFGGVY